MIGEEIRAPQAGASLQPPRPEAVHASRLKMENPWEYDGKPTMLFNIWWESVEDYLSFNTGMSEAQKIAWVGTWLTGTAKAWHLHRRTITRRTGDTWGAYSEAIQMDFQDSQEAANALEKIGQLRYKGDINAFDFLEDGDFLTATYKAGIHVEKRKRLEATRRWQEGGGNKDAQGTGKGPGKTERSGKSRNTDRKEVDHKQSERTDLGG